MSVNLTAGQARRLRLRSHLLDGSELAPADVVRRAVALQGQDLPAVQRAIAVRSRPGTTVAEVRAAFDAGELVRSWPMRGTLFATTPEHLRALLSFTGERIHRATARRREQLGLSDAVVAHAREVLAEALAVQPLRRAEVLDLWEAAGITTADGRGYHLLMNLSVAGLAHWGAFDETGAEQYLTLTSGAPPEDPDAALAEVVRGFVLARGPVTADDLAWWTKLPKTLLRRAAAHVEDLVEVQVEGTKAWMIGDPAPPEAPAAPDAAAVTLVPGFDEWILGYADRSLVAGPGMLQALVPGGNGVFRPAVLVDGLAVGTWRLKRTGRGAPQPVIELVEPVPARTREAVEAAVAAWPHG